MHNAFFFFSSRRRHTRYWRDWSSDVCSSDLIDEAPTATPVDSAAHNAAIAWIAVTCCAARPGVGRPARIRTTRTGVSVSAERRSEERRVGKEGGAGGAPEDW